MDGRVRELERRLLSLEELAATHPLILHTETEEPARRIVASCC